LPTENENEDFVMPAWIAGIQVRKDASGDVHVNLDSSSPCWNDELRALLEVTEVPPAVFSKERTKVLARQSRNQNDRLVSLV